MNITFHDGSSARLDPATPEWSAWGFALSQLQRYELPAYIEADSETGSILEYQVPVSGRIARLDPLAGRGHRILLEGTFCFFRLHESNPNFERYWEILLRAREDVSTVILTRKDEPCEIVDLRISPQPRGPAPARRATPLCNSGPGEIQPVTMDCLNAMFNLVYGKNCIPQAETTDCIPFLFSDYGCEARAHKMCELISSHVTPAKVLNYPLPNGTLTVKTPNVPKCCLDPNCFLEWTIHIAPVLPVDTGGGITAIYVIDPSLFPGGPVTLANWLAVQNGSGGYYLVSWQCFEPLQVYSPGPWDTDPGGSMTDSRLAACQSALNKRYPPYQCP